MGKPQKFEAVREVVAKKKTFTCKYLLIYKVAGQKFTVDKKKSKVACSPDSKGNFGVVTETFTVGTKSVQVTHAIKKGKDTVTGLAIAEATGGSGNGSGGSGGGSGGSGGGSGGSGVSGDDMDCTCTIPLPDMSALSSSTPLATGRSKLVTTKLQGGAIKECIVVGNHPISCWLKEITESVRANGHHGVSQPSKIEQLLPLAILFILSALAAYGKVTLLQNLGILPTGRNALGQENQHKEQLEELSRLFHAANRQFGGGLGGLGGLLGGGNGGTAGNLVDGATNALVEQAIQQWMANGGVENLIMQFISGGGLELMVTQFFSSGGFESLVAGAMANLDEQALQSLGQAAGENIQQELANIDMEGMMENMTSELGADLDQMMAALEEAVANNQIEEPQMEMSCTCRPRT